MDKNIKITELESVLNIELKLLSGSGDERDGVEIYNNRNAYSVNNKGNIEKLNMSANNIETIDLLGDLNSLTHLILNNNQIHNINALNKLKNLKVLDLGNNKIVDATPLVKLTNLEFLELDHNLITDFPTIKKSKLVSLRLNNNQLKNTKIFSALENLKILDLRQNTIEELSGLESLYELEALYLANNYISDIRALRPLTKLNNIDFSNNSIVDISPLKNLSNLHTIIFSSNQIFDLSPIYGLLKKNENLNYNFFDNPLIYPASEVYQRGHVLSWFDIMNEMSNEIIDKCIESKNKTLDLGNCGITDILLLERIFDCEHIEELILSNEWAESAGEDWIKKYSKNGGVFRNNLFEIPSEISKLKNLKKLIIGGDWENENFKINKWRINDISFTKSLKNLRVLNASNNNIEIAKISPLLQTLEHLYLNNNIIYKVTDISKLKNLKVLNISNNNISDLSFLKASKSLKILDLHSNNILNIDDLFDISSTAIKINIFNLPFSFDQQLKLAKYENHIGIIKNYFSLRDMGQYDYVLPIKVLLLGNHQAGKSTLLDYLTANKRGRKIVPTKESTHIVRIQKFPKSSGMDIPEIIYFDFGGQDYYHGIYKAFLTNDAINILLWNKRTNRNQIRKDLSNGILTRDFKLDYWLFQLKYYYKDISKKNRNTITEIGKEQNEDVVFLCQTYAEEFGKEALNQDIEYLNILNEFYITLQQTEVDGNDIYRLNLDYLENTLKYTIAEKRRQKRFTIKRPIWFGTFLTFILNYKDERSMSIDVLRKQYARQPNVGETEESILDFMKQDLDQLHRQGIVLYYIDVPELNKVVWLNPSSIINFIHRKILSKELLKTGLVEKNSFISAVKDPNLLQLLKLQNVIFEDISYERFIIPSFLPLSTEPTITNQYNILTFGLNEPAFILKFLKFIPFGLVNQLICSFGNEKDSKYFWRDQLIFTLNGNSKILIKLDFRNLEILVYFSYENVDSKIQKLTQKYIFNCLISIYYDIPILTFSEFQLDKEDFYNSIDERIKSRNSNVVNFIESLDNMPDDLYISIDNKWFVKAADINNSEYNIISYGLDENTYFLDVENPTMNYRVREINMKLHKELPNYNFQYFTNKKLSKMKKIFISYSRKDVDYKDELKKHLNILKTFDIADNWSCEEISIGKWDSQIQQELEKSDLIIYMLSANFFSSKYILEQEVQKGMDLINVNPDKNILCIIVSSFTGLEKLKNDTGNRNELQDALLKLADYQYLPYANVLNNVTNQNEEKIIPLKDYARMYNIETALEQITSKILGEVQK